MAKMADRCILLLDEYFAEQSPAPLSPTVHTDVGDASHNLSVGSSTTQLADQHSVEKFHRYSELPTELQDMILEEALTVRRSRSPTMRLDGTKPPAPAVAAVDKNTREQVVRIMKKANEGCGGFLNRTDVGQSEEAHLESLTEQALDYVDVAAPQ
ncbi:hypothetical protein N0V93_002738 [Gnomoniopsis smithogilvyi]|uniref:Uncharacterized protein n=1 Tax=Gnomoniopsis smithogilvyi TaxID=1191159 RepID=A0A9W8YXB2_9PEZI|nr:hypothetical protein N0V93_002738 [Gnomoniopsis smithogilvyi]